ncbi:hypothetical protein DSO57_1020184 [Entomophthora muscae]|uniref:Uncharacterized protein n=1 Tax=Entomophthora muscae TaxID=34485 RepID=A0ACC2RV19_9FUNG|nr:hypothetical protein DSO57_1020184 [Entomophthora muscae]
MFMIRSCILYILATALSGLTALPANTNAKPAPNVELARVVGKVPVVGPLIGPAIDPDFNKNNPPEPPAEIPLMSFDDFVRHEPRLSDEELYPEDLEIPDTPGLPINSPPRRKFTS